MNDKPKRLEDVTITCNVEPGAEADVEAMCEAIKDQIQQELFEWQRTTTKIPYDDGPFKGLLGKSLRKAFASAIGVDDNGQCLLTEMEHQTITFKSHDQWARHQEEEVVVPKDWVVTADLQLNDTGLMTYHRITATPGTPFKPSGPILPSSTQKETTMNITWTTGPGKQTARNGDREARLTKGGLYWYAEGHVDLQWGAVSLGASRDVVELKQAAMAWLKGDAEWERHQRDLGFVAVYDETQAEEKEQQMTQKALDTLRQPAKK
jgi:hypothetical protein